MLIHESQIWKKIFFCIKKFAKVYSTQNTLFSSIVKVYYSWNEL